jgi:hypothetical protein
MAKYRKTHLLFFLLTIIPMQFIFPPISSPGGYLPLSWGPDDDPELACYRVYHGESSGNYSHIIDVGNVKLPAHRAGLPGNEISFLIMPPDPAYKAGLAGHLPVILYRSSWKPYLQVLHELRGHSLTNIHLGKSSPYRYSPPMAQSIPPPPSLKAAMSTSITPLVIFSEYLLTTTVTDKIVYLLFMLCYSLCIFSWLIKKHPDI